MSTNKNLEKYKELYSKYVEARINLHNYHTVFVNNVGRDSSAGVRKNIGAMERLEKALKMTCRAAFLEQLELDRAAGKYKKLQEKYVKPQNKRKKKNDINQ
jgi:hypothetical protein